MATHQHQRPLILVTNDDSVEAPGLYRLIDCLEEFGDIIAVAPAYPCSGQSSSLTVGRPLHIIEKPDYHHTRVFAVTGTPVDCVKLGLAAIMPRTPNFVFSGINHGSNSGTSITYSGTMGAALEGTMAGIPSVGFSLLTHSLKADFGYAMPWIKEIARKVIEDVRLPAGVCLNVNIPAKVEPLGVKVCRAARGHWTEEYQRYLDPSGNPFFWLTGRFVCTEPDATDTDEYWLANNYISVVPAQADQSDLHAVEELKPIFTTPRQ